MNGTEPILSVAFYRTETGREPVREWLKSLPREERRIIGEDIKTVQFGWPLGMPLVRKLDKGLWEVRSRLPCSATRRTLTQASLVPFQSVPQFGFLRQTGSCPF